VPYQYEYHTLHGSSASIAGTKRGKNPSIHPSVHLTNHRSIDPSIHPYIHTATHQYGTTSIRTSIKSIPPIITTSTSIRAERTRTTQQLFAIFRIRCIANQPTNQPTNQQPNRTAPHPHQPVRSKDTIYYHCNARFNAATAAAATIVTGGSFVVVHVHAPTAAPALAGFAAGTNHRRRLAEGPRAKGMPGGAHQAETKDPRGREQPRRPTEALVPRRHGRVRRRLARPPLERGGTNGV